MALADAVQLGNPGNSLALPSDESTAEENSSDSEVEDELYAKALIQEKKALQNGRRKEFASFSDLESDDDDWVVDKVVRRFQKNTKREEKKPGSTSEEPETGDEELEDVSDDENRVAIIQDSSSSKKNVGRDNTDHDIDSDYEVIEVDFDQPVTETVDEFNFEEVEAYDDGYDVEDVTELIKGVDLDETVRNLCDGFCDHLQTIDGGLKNEKTALSHRGVILRLYPVLGQKIENFWDRKSLNSWVKGLQKEKKAPGTIKTYLGSICFFLEYLRDEMPPQYASHAEDIKNIIPR